MRILGFLAATVLLFVCPVAVGQTTLDKVKNDELAFVPKNDPAMARAFDYKDVPPAPRA
jgi:hypothetical protein